MTRLNKLLTISLLAVLLIVAVLPFSAVFAEVSVQGFDGTSIYDDLKDASILGKTFDINDYPVNENGTPELLAFVEFAFSLKHEYQPYYGLYLYVYYPQGNLVVDSELNNVEMANKYEGNEAVNWSKYTLQFCDKDYNGVLYKFKVLDSRAEPEHTIAETYGRVAMSSSERRYDISGIELHNDGNVNATEYGIGGTWTITGYSQGMHESSMEESTLQSVATFENTLKLDVNPTYFRSWRNADNTLADQLSSVYFSVPNSIDSEYDQLYAIDFEAYKYLSSPIFCIYDKPIAGHLGVDVEQVYENLLNQRGKTSAEVVKMSEYTWLTWDRHYVGDVYMNFGYYAHTPGADSTTNLDQLAWVLQAKNDLDYKIGAAELLNYMAEFSNKFGRTVRNKYNSLLFSDHYYFRELDYRTFENGLNIGRKITATEEFELVGSLSQHNIWQYLSLLFKTYDDKETTFNPIQKVTYNEIESLTNEGISQQFFVAESDVLDFKTYVKQQNSIDKSVYLFRFDVDTYYTSPLRAELWGECGYVAQEPIYLDFDIISLTYEKENVQTVIPVVSNPIDIIAGIEPPGIDLLPDNADLVNLYMLVIIVLAIVLVGPLVLGALKFIFNIR